MKKTTYNKLETNINTMEIQIEFGGFYGFHYEYIESRIEQFNDGAIYADDCYDVDNIDWQKTF